MAQRMALVTGGMGGIGEAICIRLAQSGARVATTHSPGNRRAAEWLAAMKERGYDFIAAEADVTSLSSCQGAVERIRDAAGPIDILVNNAGIISDASFRKMEKAAWDTVLRTDLDSLFNMTKQVIEGMAERGWGRVVNISSVNAQKGAFGQTNYSAAKAGMHGFTKALALEYARKGVTVNTVSPGYIATKMVLAIPQDVLDSKIIPQIPVGRLGKPEEVAALVVYICSDDAAFMTGANVALNGGQHMF